MINCEINRFFCSEVLKIKILEEKNLCFKLLTAY